MVLCAKRAILLRISSDDLVQTNGFRFLLCTAMNSRMAFSNSDTLMLEVMMQDYIRTAWAKGLKERVIVTKHALKNGIIPVVTLVGMGISQILAGSVLIETVFAVNGIGRLLVNSTFNYDYPYVQAIVLMIAIAIVLANLLVDLSYAWIDPRVRYE